MYVCMFDRAQCVSTKHILFYVCIHICVYGVERQRMKENGNEDDVLERNTTILGSD